MRSLRAPGLALVVLLLALGLSVWRFAPPAPLGPDAAETAFSASRALDTLQAVVGDAPHPTGSTAHREVRARLAARLESMGLRAEEQRATRCSSWGLCAELVNVLAEIPGESPGAILLATHYDSVPAAPGASDDGAGVAALLETARALLASGPRARTVILVFTDGEEMGLLGARAFVAEHPAMKRVEVVINLEARGVSGPSMMFETSGPNARLVPRLRALPRPVTTSLMNAVYERLPNDTDFSVFRDAGVPGYNFAFIRDFARYHTPQDDLAHLDRGSLQHHGDNLLALTRSLLDTPLPDGDGDAVWFELLGWLLLWWPLSWSMALAVVAAALVLAAVARSFSVEEGFFPRYMRALGAALATLLLSLALGYGVARLMYGRLPSVIPDQAHPELAMLAVALGVLAMGTAVIGWTTKHCGVTAASAAGWTLWALFGAITSREIPAACHLFVVPTLLAGVAGLVVLRLPADDPRRTDVMLLPQGIGALLWLEALLGLRDTFGLVAAFATGPVVGLWMASSLPAWARPEEGPRPRWTRLVFAVPALLLSVVAYLVPPYGPQHPQRMSITYYQAKQTAQWWVEASFGDIPEALREAGQLGGVGPSPHPFAAYQRAQTGPTRSVGLAPPTLEVVTVQGNRWRLRGRSVRGAHILTLLVPPGAALEAKVGDVTVRPLTLADSPLFPGYRSFGTVTLPAEGIELEVVTDAPSILVADISYDLPPAAEPLLTARAPDAFATWIGDLSIVVERVPLERP